MKNMLTVFSLYAAFTISNIGLAVAADTSATTNSAINADSNGSLVDKNGNRIGVKGQPEKTFKEDDKNGHQLDQNGKPIQNGLDSRGVVIPKHKTKHHKTPAPKTTE